MALQANDSFQINNITDSISCIISSTGGEALIDAELTPILTCRLFSGDGEIDSVPEELEEEEEEEYNYQYYYVWKRNGVDWRDDNEIATGKQLFLIEEDLESDGNVEDLLVFSCSVYEEDPLIAVNEVPMIAYGEINLDMTIKKWMTFDDQTGLWVRKTGSEWTTLTDEKGYHIYKVPEEANESLNPNNLNWIGSFAEESLMTPKIRLLGNSDLSSVLNIGQISVIPTNTYGWNWVLDSENKNVDLTSLFSSEASRSKYITEIDSQPIGYYIGDVFYYY